MVSRKWSWVTALLFSVTLAAAQDTCPTVVQDALAALDTKCELTERNQACYGNVALTALPQESATEFKFDSIGDIEDLNDIDTLDLEPLDPTLGQWGLVMMRVQADIPDSMPGQNVTFILFGDVTIQNAATEDQLPMQAFYLTTGIGESNCVDAPDSGLMVQTPSGVKEVSFNVNGVDVEMGSTVFFQANPGKEMRVKTIEGKARLRVGDEIVPVVQGSEYTAPINEDLEITEPGEIIPYTPEEVEFLPTEALERKIDISEPLTEDEIEEVKRRESSGERLCSDDEDSFLPPCTRPMVDANGDEVQYDERGAPILIDEEGRPLFYDREGNPILSEEQYDDRLEEWTEVKPRGEYMDDDSIIYPDVETDPDNPRLPPDSNDPERDSDPEIFVPTQEPDKRFEPTRVPDRELPPTRDPNTRIEPTPDDPDTRIEPTVEDPKRDVPPTDDPNTRINPPPEEPNQEEPPPEEPRREDPPPEDSGGEG